MNAPSPRVAALLAKVRQSLATRARLIFALDATASRERTWDLACHLQGEMFAEAARVGGLEIQLVFYRGENECSASGWAADAQVLTTQMRRIRCVAGTTQIGRVLQHIRKEHARGNVTAAIFVGDAVEEPLGSLYDVAADINVPVFLFQEGNGLAVNPDPYDQVTTGYPTQTVEGVFCEIARLSGGAYSKFDIRAAKQLGELLRAVAAFAGGGIPALEDLRTNSARKLLGQMKQRRQP
jgi:hypothetical protein